jgi:hypothetical protein
MYQSRFAHYRCASYTPVLTHSTFRSIATTMVTSLQTRFFAT